MSGISSTENAADVDEFLKEPLAQWFISCFDGEKISYEDIIDGPLLNHIFLKTCRTKFNEHRLNQSSSRRYDPVYSSTPFDEAILASGGVTSIRSRNLESLLANLRRYYDDLNRILVRLPDVSSLAREPRLHTSEAELILCLLLGCAVNCERQLEFFEGIQRLDEHVQFVIAECAIKVEREPGLLLDRNMLNAKPGESEDEHSRRMDDFFEAVRVLDRERNELCLKLRSGAEARRADEAEANLRTTRRELERVLDELAEREDEIEQNLVEMDKLRRDNEMLASEARSLNYYRDELDEAKEKVAKADQLELEVSRLKEKLDELVYSKSRLEELHEEMRLFSLKKASLDEELGSLRGENRIKAIKISSLEKRIDELQRKLEETSGECRKRVEECEKLRRDNERLARKHHQAASLQPETSIVKSEPLSYSFSNAESSKFTPPITIKHFPRHFQSLPDQRTDLRQKLEEFEKEIKRKDDAIDELKRACSVSLDENKRLREEMKKLLENLESRQNTDPYYPYRKVNKRNDPENRKVPSSSQKHTQTTEASTSPIKTISAGHHKEIGKSVSTSDVAYFKHTPVVPVNNRRRKIDSLVKSKG